MRRERRGVMPRLGGRPLFVFVSSVSPNEAVQAWSLHPSSWINMNSVLHHGRDVRALR